MWYSNKKWFPFKKWLALGKAGFTLREVIIVIVILSVGLLSTVVILNNGVHYVQKTRQRVIALNLAREGMEAVYQMRDTNWQRWAGKKDACRLKSNPLTDENTVGCSNDTWMMTWHYALQYVSTAGQEYFILTWRYFTWLNLTNGIESWDLNFGLCLLTGRWMSCVWNVSTTSEGRYFREIEGVGLFTKDPVQTWWVLLSCNSWASVPCGSSLAKEFRFCSIVAYVNEGTGEVKICGVITNFEQQ